MMITLLIRPSNTNCCVWLFIFACESLFC